MEEEEENGLRGRKAHVWGGRESIAIRQDERLERDVWTGDSLKLFVDAFAVYPKNEQIFKRKNAANGWREKGG